MSETNGATAATYTCTGCGQSKAADLFSYAINKRVEGSSHEYRFKKCRVCRNQQALDRYRLLADDARRMAILDALPCVGRIPDPALRDEIMEGVQNLLRKKS